jgi:hypothetical protein
MAFTTVTAFGQTHHAKAFGCPWHSQVQGTFAILMPLKEYETRDLLEIVEARHQKGSTIFLSQFSPAGWHAKIGEGTLADAILDRIVIIPMKFSLMARILCGNAKGLKSNSL